MQSVIQALSMLPEPASAHASGIESGASDGSVFDGMVADAAAKPHGAKSKGDSASDTEQTDNDSSTAQGWPWMAQTESPPVLPTTLIAQIDAAGAAAAEAGEPQTDLQANIAPSSSPKIADLDAQDDSAPAGSDGVQKHQPRNLDASEDHWSKPDWAATSLNSINQPETSPALTHNPILNGSHAPFRSSWVENSIRDVIANAIDRDPLTRPRLGAASSSDRPGPAPAAVPSTTAFDHAAVTFSSAKAQDGEPQVTDSVEGETPPPGDANNETAPAQDSHRASAAPSHGLSTADMPASPPTSTSATPSADAIAAITPNNGAATSSVTDAEKPAQIALAVREGRGADMDAIALHIAARSARGDSRFSIRLDPPELGKVDVNLSVNAQGHAQAVLAVEKPQTLDLLQRDATALERALKDAGLDLAGGLSFSLKGEARPHFAREENGFGRSRALEIAAVDAANTNSALIGSIAGQYYGPGGARLDITV